MFFQDAIEIFISLLLSLSLLCCLRFQKRSAKTCHVPIFLQLLRLCFIGRFRPLLSWFVMVIFILIYYDAWPPSLWVRFKALLIFLLVVHLLLQGSFHPFLWLVLPSHLLKWRKNWLFSCYDNLFCQHRFLMADWYFYLQFERFRLPSHSITLFFHLFRESETPP